MYLPTFVSTIVTIMICWLASESDECDKDHQPINNVKSEVKVMHFHRNYQRCSPQPQPAYLSTDVCVLGGWELGFVIAKIFTCLLSVLFGGLALAYQSSPSCYLLVNSGRGSSHNFEVGP